MFLKNRWEIIINLSSEKYKESIPIIRKCSWNPKVLWNKIRIWWGQLFTLKLSIDLKKGESINDILKIINRVK